MTPPRARRVYRVLLALLPRRLQAYQDEMAELFDARLEAAARRGRWAASAAWVRAGRDLAAAWPREAARRMRQQGRVGVPRPGGTMMLGSDLRYAVRSLTRQKLASGLVLGMLAVGIAANVTVFSMVNGLFFRPFPFPDADRLVFVNERAPKWNLEIAGVNFPDFDTWRRGQQAFASMAVWDMDELNFADARGAERLPAALVSHEFAGVLGVTPILGRMFTPEEDVRGGPPVVLISHGVWQERFGGEPGVLGRTLKLNGIARSIIGVLPPEADVYPGGARLWVPLQGDPAQPYQSYSYNVLGRLRPGVTIETAEQDLLRVHEAIFETRDRERVVSPFVLPLRELNVRDFRTAATTLTAAVALLLLVACANVAAVMLGRALARRREIGIRVAVGASRMRLLRQLFVENLLLAVAGGALGLLLGQWAIGALVELLPDTAPPWARFGLDARVMAFAAGSSILTALLFGWAPALHAIRGDVRAAMNDGADATSSSPGSRRTLRWLIAAEFAMATVLLVCGGLLLRAYDRVQATDPGFTPRGVTTFTLSLPRVPYGESADLLAFWDRLEPRLAGVSGVMQVGLVSCPPFGCHWGQLYVAEGAPPPRDGDANPVVLNRVATPGYFAAMGIRLKAGRFFDERDGRGGAGAERVVIVNETLARALFPGVENPVGRRIRGTGDRAHWNRIVGYVEDVRHYGLERPMRPGVYWPLPQAPMRTMTAAVKSDLPPDALVPMVRATVADLDPELPLFRVQTMETSLRQTLSVRVAYSWLLAVFALAALALALGGSYGVSSYLVAQRRREIGIRLALGARRSDIARGVLRASLGVIAAGVAAGIGASLAVARLLDSLLFGVNPHDALVVASAAGVLVGTALVANVLPARLATRVDPIRSLRTE